MKVIIVAYNQFELLQMEIEALRLLAGIEERDLIIVDNGSEDGLRQWLEERPGRIILSVMKAVKVTVRL